VTRSFSVNARRAGDGLTPVPLPSLSFPVSVPAKGHSASSRSGVFEQVAIAKRLGVSVPTLRRRLQAEGQPSFRVLHDRALNRAARALLAQRHHPKEVAEELGFCDLRSFSRAFKRWNETTPAAYARCHSPHCG
jgi:hypothetical protein